MKMALVGYTGFVGSNLCEQTNFQYKYNSKNIHIIQDENFDLVIYSGVKAEKYIANKDPCKDLEHIKETIETIKKINTNKFLLISTIDVYDNILNVNEDTNIADYKLQPYGKNRRLLEKWVMRNISNYTIVRLPALYGINLKKNFIFDMINIVPTTIKYEKFIDLNKICPFNLNKFYSDTQNGFYRIQNLDKKEFNNLKNYFKDNNFNSLKFTDERNEYPFYNLKNLWTHINIALENNINLVNLATEPLTSKEIYEYVYNKPFNNITENTPIKYNIKSKYSNLFNGRKGYIFNKNYILSDIKTFIDEVNLKNE